MKVICLHHKDIQLEPTMIKFHNSRFGNSQYVCARCSRIREIGSGRIKVLKGTYGFINNGTKDIFFHFKYLNNSFQPFINAEVLFEVAFLEDGIEAINIREFKSGKKKIFKGLLKKDFSNNFSNNAIVNLEN